MWTRLCFEETGALSKFVKGKYPKGIHLLLDGDLDGGSLRVRVRTPLSTTYFVLREKDDDTDLTWHNRIISTAGCYRISVPLLAESIEIYVINEGVAANYSVYILGPVIWCGQFS